MWPAKTGGSIRFRRCRQERLQERGKPKRQDGQDQAQIVSGGREQCIDGVASMRDLEDALKH